MNGFNIADGLNYIREYKRPIKIMEVCGTHTSAIVKNGIYSLLPPNIKLVSGPGCPVCVTEAGFTDKLIEISEREHTCVLCFGDMMKVRGRAESFSDAKARGASFHIIYSPLEAVDMAKKSSETQFVIAAVGFETTIPIYALLMETLILEGIKNVKLVLSLKTMLPALSFICENERIDGFICPGHVSVIIGKNAYEGICAHYKKPFVIAGFEPEQITRAICEIITQTDKNNPRVVNLYKSAVKESGNLNALNMINKYFVPCDGYWRGIGIIKDSALALRSEFSEFLAEDMLLSIEEQPSGCRCAEVLLGRITPAECGLFGKACKPNRPIGACMVSSEGACGIWYSNVLYEVEG